MRRPFILLGLVMFRTITQAQDAPGLDFPEVDNTAAEDMYQVANCIFFGPGRGQFKFQLQRDGTFLNLSGKHPKSELTQQVMRVVGSSVTQSNYVPGASRNHASQDIQSLGTIDKYIFGAPPDAGAEGSAERHRLDRSGEPGLAAL
jgi:hypothetical protein